MNEKSEGMSGNCGKRCIRGIGKTAHETRPSPRGIGKTAREMWASPSGIRETALETRAGFGVNGVVGRVVSSVMSSVYSVGQCQIK